MGIISHSCSFWWDWPGFLLSVFSSLLEHSSKCMSIVYFQLCRFILKFFIANIDLFISVTKRNMNSQYMLRWRLGRMCKGVENKNGQSCAEVRRCNSVQFSRAIQISREPNRIEEEVFFINLGSTRNYFHQAVLWWRRGKLSRRKAWILNSEDIIWIVCFPAIYY